MSATSPPATPEPAKPDPVKVVIVDAAAPVPVNIVGHADPLPRPDTPTGRPDPLPPNPSREQLRQERQALHASNAGRFTVEEPESRRPGPAVVQVKDSTTITVLTLLCVLHIIKLLLVFWILMVVMQSHDYLQKADTQRESIAADLAVLKTGLTEGLAEQQLLVKRVDDALRSLPK